jgi:cytoskeletal protein CcmA (bactofilin family)
MNESQQKASFYEMVKGVYMLGKSKGVKKDDEAAVSPDFVAEQTVIGEHISIKGGIKGKEDLVINGSVNGTIKLGGYHLTVGPTGQVEGEIHADNVTISGRVSGNIKALDKVEITKEADFNGEVKAKRISVEDGAYLKAVIELEKDAEKKAVPADKLADQATPGPDKEPLTLISETDKRK